MSVATMARLVRQRQVREREAPALQSKGLDQEKEESNSTLTTALERLTAFVPTEVVAGWAAAVGMLTPQDAVSSWAIFGGALAFLVILVLLETGIRDKESQVKTDPRRKALLVLVALVAFSIWAFASPGSPAAAAWGTSATRYFGVVAIAVSAILFRVGQLLGLAPLE
jgi:polyferredoxin